MPKVTPISTRKADHININLDKDVRSAINSGLERYRFIHQALPELNLDRINLHQDLFGRTLHAPLFISSMTGGTNEAALINRNLATAAQETRVAMGLGSQRAAIEQPELASTFRVRQYAPDILLFANLGAVQLNYGYCVDHCLQAVEMIEADALILHLNPLQEALQSEGDTNFAGLLSKIKEVCQTMPVPVIVKEVGWGISEQAANHLFESGVAAIDVAGAGGTSWSQVEMHRAKDQYQAKLAAAFIDWGIPTAESILNVRRIAPHLPIFASGGLRSGTEIAKCIALGATLGGMARPLLKAAALSVAETVQTIIEIRREIQVCMFAVGAANLEELRNAPLQEITG